MGFTGELVRSVFSRNRSTNHHETKVRSNNNGVEKRRRVSVKSYFCSDELDSVVAEEDSASVRSSEVRASQPIYEEALSGREEESKSEETVENNNVTDNVKKNSNSKLLNEEEAAILIQSAYRAFLKRRQNEGMKKKTSEEEEELSLVIESADVKSMGTSIEVQTGNSIEVYTLEAEKGYASHYRSLHRPRSQVLKQKEDWDDSTVSSYVSKMRMQNRMEASTRRERAVAYAFSQQLRICSKKKSNIYNNTNEEPNMTWSWLERWMATRLPDTASVVESHYGLNNNHGYAVRKRFLDVACREEKESCGSNSVPLQFDNHSTTSQEVKDHEFISPQTKEKNNLKSKRRTVSRRKTVPSFQFSEEHFKVSKRYVTSGVRKDNRQLGSMKTEMKSNSPSRT